MQHSFLVSFLNGESPPEDFARAIKQEVDACEEGVSSPAKVGYIVITDGPKTIVTEESVRRLLQFLLEESVPWTSLNYTANCLMLSDDFEFESEQAEDAIAFLSDESRAPTADEIIGVLETLS